MRAEPDPPSGPSNGEQRLRSLLRANSSIVGELTLSAVLHRIVDAARELVGVEYGALGVIAPDRRSLEEFVHAGISPETAAAIGPLPQGEGLLGALIEDPRPIRLRRIGDDARSVGFPGHHPPMTSFLGVPIVVRGVVFGNLYLCGSTPRDFTDDDVEAVASLAATAAIAIDNARLFEQAQRRQDWLEQTSALTRSLLETPADVSASLVVDTVLRLGRADRVAWYAAGRGHAAAPLAVAGDPDPVLPAALERALGAHALNGGVPVRRDEEGELEAAGPLPQDLNEPRPALPGSAAPLMVVPLLGAGGGHGALVVSRRPGGRGFAAEDLDTAVTFAGHVCLALELVARRHDQQRVQLLEERARIARDLHDHVVQQLFAAGMTIQGVMAALGEGPQVALLDRAVDLVDEAVGQIRTSIFHLRAQPRDSVGVRAGVLDTVSELRSTLGPSAGLEPHVRFEGPVDAMADPELVADVRAVVREALTNVARHARAATVSVSVRADGAELELVVADDGTGVVGSRRSGLANLEDRARRRGGSLAVSAPPRGTGTMLRWSVPVPVPAG